VVGIVVVSHSSPLAEGVVALAREMGGSQVALEAAGGLEDGSIGTDAERVRAAIERALVSADGVLVLMDLGSALMSAELAAELLSDEQRARLQLSDAPLVEGAVAAAAAARGGASLREVRDEARRSLEMKLSHLAVVAAAPAACAATAGDAGAAHAEVAPGGAGAVAPGGAGAAAPTALAPDALQARIPVLNEIGLHARPAALVVALAGRFETVDLRLAKVGGAGPVSARSLSGLMTLVARKGDQLLATASGPHAREALAELERLAHEGFGDRAAPSGALAVAPGGHRPGAAARGPGAALGLQAAPSPATAPSLQTATSPPPPGTALRGIPAAAGIAVGPARRLHQRLDAPAAARSRGPEVERRRLESAREIARAAIERDRDAVARRGATSEAAIFTTHLALLDDDELISAAQAQIDAGAAAETAWYDASAQTAAAWRALDDELLAERAADVEDGGRRVLAALAGPGAGTQLRVEGVVVVDELTPAAAAALDPALVRGIATARGTATAHAAILARAIGIPAVVGLGPRALAIAQDTPLLLDGDEGTVVVAPDSEALSRAHAARDLAKRRRREARQHALEPAAMRDGTRIEVAANLGGAAGARAAVELGADAVGLLRTEFLFLDRPQIPSEDEQAETIEAIARDLGGRPLIVRTLDAGADKPLPALAMPPERNPFLGRRGLRLSLQHPDLFAVQLRAVLRVAAAHPVKLMFPMVSTVDELDAALAAVAQARRATGVQAPLEVGIMVEVPAAALQARQLAHCADFFSIGTNDLAQYTMAAERGNELVGDLLRGAQPAVLRLIDATVAGARARGRWVGVCGELAGDPVSAVLLVGLGVRELSMAPPLIPDVKAALRSIALTVAQQAARRALAARDSAQARQCAADLL